MFTPAILAQTEANSPSLYIEQVLILGNYYHVSKHGSGNSRIIFENKTILHCGTCDVYHVTKQNGGGTALTL